MKFTAYAETDVGQRRAHNEDSLLSRPDIGLFIVCDGMGGHAAGEVASALAMETVAAEVEANIEMLVAHMEGEHKERLRAHALLVTAVKHANHAVRAAADADPSRRGMGTTLTALFVSGSRAIVAQVGDSRLYLVRDRQSHQVTTDHTILTEMVRAGRVDPNDPVQIAQLNALTRAVGVHPEVDVDTVELDILPGDVVLVCSDGLHGYFDDLDLGSFFAHTTEETSAANLIEFANKHGGHDNISAIVVRWEDTEVTQQQLHARLTLDTLKTIPLFHYLSFSELLRLIPVSQPVLVDEGACLIEEATTGTDLYIVIDGGVRVHKGANTISDLGPGRYFGEMSLVDNRPRSASVTATQASHLIRITRDDFYQVLRADSVLAVKLLWNFIQTLSSFVRLQNQTLQERPSFKTSPAHPYQTGRSLSAEEQGE